MAKKKQAAAPSENLITWPKKFSRAKKPLLITLALLFVSLLVLTVVDYFNHRSLDKKMDELASILAEKGIETTKTDRCTQGPNIKFGGDFSCLITLSANGNGSSEEMYESALSTIDGFNALTFHSKLAQNNSTDADSLYSYTRTDLGSLDSNCSARLLFERDAPQAYEVSATCSYNAWQYDLLNIFW